MSKPPNEFEVDFNWQQDIAERLVLPILRAEAYRGQIVQIDFRGAVAQLLQKRAGVDYIAQTPHGGMLSIELKLVRWPGAKQGRPSQSHWPYIFLETKSSSTYDRDGWFHVSAADVLLWGQVSLQENFVDCWPISFPALRRWFVKHVDKLDERIVPNVISGVRHNTIGKLARISDLKSDLHLQQFSISGDGLICDLFGKPLLHFLAGND